MKIYMDIYVSNIYDSKTKVGDGSKRQGGTY